MAVNPRLKAMSYSTVGLEFVVSIIIGFLGGQWIDKKLGTTYFTLIGFFFGVATGFRFLWRAAKRMQRDTETDGFKESDADRPMRDDDSPS